ncbi:MAG TPA: hypothetical protein VHT53_12835 [Candidatus Elarobacter sp.]|nr:hypothetical protein [Candidatus Elarobacter sp.]
MHAVDAHRATHPDQAVASERRDAARDVGNVRFPAEHRDEVAARGRLAARDGLARGERRNAFLVAVVERARRREPVARGVVRVDEVKVEVRRDDPRVARRHDESLQRGERRSEAAGFDGERARRPVLDDGERAVRSGQLGDVWHRGHVGNGLDGRHDAHAERARAACERGERSAREHGVPEPAQPRVVERKRIDDVARDPARAAETELRFQRRGRGERVRASVVRKGDSRDASRLGERGTVQRERAEHAARRVEAIERVVRARPDDVAAAQAHGGVPVVEGVRERRLPAERRERVLQREIDEALDTPRRELADRERRVRRIRGARLRILRPREPPGLELAVRQRHRALRAQRRGRERELGAIVLADRVRVALIPVAHRPHGRRGRHLHVERVDEHERARADDIAHLRLEPAQIRVQVRRRIRVVVEIRALVVVELHGEHAIGDGAKLGERAVQPPRGVPAVRRVAHPLRRGGVGMRVLQRRGGRIAALEHVVQRHPVRRTLQQPRRIAAVAPFVANHRPRAHEESKAELRPEPQHLAQIAARARAPGEVEIAVAELVPVPRHVEVERVRAEIAHDAHRVVPFLTRQALVEERAAEEEERLPVDAQVGIAVGVARDRGVSERRRPRARDGGRRGLRRKRPRSQRLRGGRHRPNGERQQQGDGSRERPQPRHARSHEVHERAGGERREPERDRDRAGRHEQEQPSGERDQRRERVERHAERRIRMAGARERERDDLTGALHDHDACGQRRDHGVQRQQGCRQREDSERDERDRGEPSAAVQPRERRQKVAVGRRGVRHARCREQQPVRRRERRHHDRDAHGERERRAERALRDRRCDRRRTHDVRRRHGGGDAEIQQHVRDGDERDGEHDRARDGARGRDHLVAERAGVAVAAVVVQRQHERVPERGDPGAERQR